MSQFKFNKFGFRNGWRYPSMFLASGHDWGFNFFEISITKFDFGDVVLYVNFFNLGIYIVLKEKGQASRHEPIRI